MFDDYYDDDDDFDEGRWTDKVDIFLSDFKTAVIYISLIFSFITVLNSNFIDSKTYIVFTFILGGLLLLDIIFAVIDFFMDFSEGLDGLSIAGWVVNIVIELAAIGGGLAISYALPKLSGSGMPIYDFIRALPFIGTILMLVPRLTINPKAIYEDAKMIIFTVFFILLMFNITGITNNNASKVGVYFAFVIIAIDIILCVIDFFMSLGDGLGLGDYINIVLNIILVTAFILGCFFGDDLLKLIFSGCGANLEYSFSFSDNVILAFACYYLLDIIISIPFNIVSNIIDLIEEA